MVDEEKIEPSEGVEVADGGAVELQEDAQASPDPPSGEQPDIAESPPQEAGAEEPVAKQEAGNPDEAGEEQPPQRDSEKVANESDVPEGDAEMAMLAMLEDLPKEEPAASPDDIDFSQAQVGNAEFQQLSQPAGQSESKNIDLLMDINLPVSIELGRTRMSIADILGLGPGSVVELNKLAGEPVDVLVNYKIVAKGEVVVIDENFGVRITQLMTPEERLRLLGEEQ